MFYKYSNINSEKIKILSNKFQKFQKFQLPNILVNTMYEIQHIKNILKQGCLGIESLRNLHLFRSFC